MNSLFRRDKQLQTGSRSPHQTIATATELSRGLSSIRSSSAHLHANCCKLCGDKQRDDEISNAVRLSCTRLDGHQLSSSSSWSPHGKGNIFPPVSQFRNMPPGIFHKKNGSRFPSALGKQYHDKREDDVAFQHDHSLRQDVDCFSKHDRKGYQKPNAPSGLHDHTRDGNSPAIHLCWEGRKIGGASGLRKTCNAFSVCKECNPYQVERPDISCTDRTENIGERTKGAENACPSGVMARSWRCCGKPVILLESDVADYSELNHTENCHPNPVLNAHHVVREFRYVRTSPELQKRILALEKEVVRSKKSNSWNSYGSLSTPPTDAVTPGLEHEPSRPSDVNIIYELGYPKHDNDVDEYFADTQWLSAKALEALRTELFRCVRKIRDRVSVSVIEMHLILLRQSMFRVVSDEEVMENTHFVVQSFISARKHTVEKFRVYLRTRRWIENIASRRRKGYLSNRQNNALRLWLFSNFQNPYPSSEDKKKLVSETQLEINQINNWLINARSRVWKPTVDYIGTDSKRRNMLWNGSGSGAKRLRISG